MFCQQATCVFLFGTPIRILKFFFFFFFLNNAKVIIQQSVNKIIVNGRRIIISKNMDCHRNNGYFVNFRNERDKSTNQLEINRNGELPKSDVKAVNANHGWRNTPRRWNEINAGIIVNIPEVTSIRLLGTSDIQLLH